MVITLHLGEMIANIFWNVEPLFMLKLIFWMNFYGGTINPNHLQFIIVLVDTSSTSTAAPSAALPASSFFSADSSSATTSIGLLNSLAHFCIINGRIWNFLI